MQIRPLRAVVRPMALLFVLFAAPAVLQAQETQDTMQLPAALRPVRAALNTALLAMDAAKAATYFADNATVEFQGQQMNGRAAVEGWLTQSFQGLAGIRFGEPGFTIRDDEVVERHSYTVTTTDGTTQPAGGSESIWRRQSDGSWKVVRLTVTS